MKEKISKIVRTKGGNTGIVIIPADIVKDSAFPFNLPAVVKVRIEGQRLIIEKVEKAEKNG